MQSRKFRALALALLPLALAGCTRGITSTPGDAPNLVKWTEEVRQRPAPPLEPIPVIKPFESFQFSSAGFRDPFDLSAVTGVVAANRPNANRRRQPLEQFPLDSLDMVGTLGRGRGLIALVMSPDKVAYRVTPGNYLGQNDGRVTRVHEDRIELIEVVPDGTGGWMERSATITLENQ